MWWLAGLAFASRSYVVPPGDADCRAAMTAGSLATADVACRCPEPFCVGRMEWLDRRRDPDGQLVGAEALERARRTGAAQGDLERIAAEPDYSDVVRADAACILASRDPDPAAVLARIDPWLPARDRMPEEIRRRLVSLAASALATLGRDDEARSLNAEIHPADAAPSEVDRLIRDRREQTAAVVAAAAVGGFTAAILPSAVRRRELGLGGWVLGASALGAYAIAEAYERGSGGPIALLAAVLLPFHLLCASAAGASPGVAFRAGAFASTLALGWLVLWADGALPW